MNPVYILLRTSNRPIFFENCYKSIREQTYSNIVLITHTDDPADTYVKGDIIINSERDIHKGRGHYNLYCNKLLEAIPDGEGWYHFIDDDDMYFSPEAIEQTVERAKRNCVNVVRSKRWNNAVWPAEWGTQRSYQTECFFMHTDHKNLARWWSKKSGDHNYSKQLTDKLKINWIDNLIICKAQEGKGRGMRFDLGEASKKEEFKKQEVLETVGRGYIGYSWMEVKYLKRVHGRSIQRGRSGDIKIIPAKFAERLQKLGKVNIIKEVKMN
jgi:hypothetical protein